MDPFSQVRIHACYLKGRQGGYGFGGGWVKGFLIPSPSALFPLLVSLIHIHAYMYMERYLPIQSVLYVFHSPLYVYTYERVGTRGLLTAPLFGVTLAFGCVGFSPSQGLPLSPSLSLSTPFFTSCFFSLSPYIYLYLGVYCAPPICTNGHMKYIQYVGEAAMYNSCRVIYCARFPHKERLATFLPLKKSLDRKKTLTCPFTLLFFS
jgi:hypothetical protein